MEQAPTLNLELPVFSSYHTPGLVENKVFNHDSKSEISLEKSVNNYLKTPAEMDAEFSLEMDTARFMSWREADDYDQKQTTIFTDQKTEYASEESPVGFMEENY